MNRVEQFNNIKNNLASLSPIIGNNYIILNEDSLNAMKFIPDNSIGLVLTDPPYHSTKKKNIANDTSFESDNEYLEWIKQFSKEWKRILRPNGSLLMFCSSAMSAKLEVLLSENFNILSNIVWTKPNEPGFDGWKQKMKKESLRQWYAHSERVIFAEPAFEGNLGKSYFANFLKMQRKKADMSMHELAEITGEFGKVNHGGSVSNWETGRNIPSKEQYLKISNALISTGKIESMPDYEDVIRPFSVSAYVEYTDIWTYPSVRPYQGKHPAEKPLDLLVHAIEATTYEGDIVLDCFAGSGNTGIAANVINRKAVLIEIEKKWTDSIKAKFIPEQSLFSDFEDATYQNPNLQLAM